MMNDKIEMIPLDHIEPSPKNRTIGGFDQAKLEQLAESIKAVGVQQPAVVRKVGEKKYQLVAGERRWRASRIAGIETLPCVVRELDDVTALKIQYIENLQRDDIHPLDESDGYGQLIAHAGYTIEMLAADVGKSISYIYQRMKLSSLIPEARKLFVENKITAGHAILIARLGPDQQKEIIEEGFFDNDDDAISVRNLDQYIHNHIMLDLSKITWKLVDAELLPAAGSCQDCAKRTGYQPALFADVCKNGKKDYCTDRSCFARKQERVVEVKREQLKDQNVFEVIDGYSGQMKLPENVIPNWAWNECKKSDPGAKKVLIVAGTQPGRTTWGKIRDQHQHPYKPDPKEAERQKKEREKEKKAEDLRKVKVDAVLQASDAWGSELPLPLEALRVCVLKIWNRWWHDHVVLIAKHEGWGVKNGEAEAEGRKRIKIMDEAQLNRLLLLIAMTDEIKCLTYNTPSSKTIDALMKIYSVKMPNKTSK
jgi:ParB/RepB/Spo0J family partition protein